LKILALSIGLLISSLFCCAQQNNWKFYNQQVLKYSQEGNSQKAIEFAILARDAAEIEFGKEHRNYADVLNVLGMLYFGVENYIEAEPIYIETISIRKKVLGEQHPDYASSLYNLADLYQRTGNNLKAETFYVEASGIYKKTLGKNHTDYANAIESLAWLYDKMGNYAKAEPLFIEANNIYKKAFGESHPDYILSLYNLAVLYRMTDSYEKAELLFIELLSISKKVSVEIQPNYLTILDNLAFLYEKRGKYSKAEQLYLEATEMYKKTIGENNADYATLVDHLASIYKNTGNYAKAESMYIKSKDVRKKALGESHPDYAASLRSMAWFYEDMGNYSKAETLYIEATEISKKNLYENNPDYATSISNLASFYGNRGNYAKAEELYIEAIAIRKRAFGEYNLDYATLLGNLGSIYRHTGNYTKSEILLVEAKDITKNALGENHSYYASSLLNLAVFYDDMGNCAKAEPLYLETMAIQKKTLGENHPFYATTLGSLAVMYKIMGNCSKAESLFIEAIGIQKIIGKNRPAYASSLKNLAVFYDNLSNYTKAEPLYIQANDNINTQIRQNFGFMSESEKEQFVNKIESNYVIFNSFALRFNKQIPMFVNLSYNNELLQKGMLLSSNLAFRQNILDSNDSILIDSYNHLIFIHKTLSKLYDDQILVTKIKLDSLNKEAENREKELIYRVKDLPGFENFNGLTGVKWQDVQRSLKPEEVAIEFTSFHYYDKRWTDSTYYCALVIRPEYEVPKMVFLFEERDLKKLLKETTNGQGIRNISQLYGLNRGHIVIATDTLYSSNALYKLVWQPLESHLSGAKTIWYSPSGLLNKLSLQAIAINAKERLSDRYQLNCLSSTRVLASGKNEHTLFIDSTSAVFFGGINYEWNEKQPQKMLNDSVGEFMAVRNIRLPDEKTRNEKMGYLPGTLSEVTAIEERCRQHNIFSTVFTSDKATEAVFKSLSGKKSPNVIHLATHGFFFEDAQKDYSKIQLMGIDRLASGFVEDPLLRSGLLFAGANRAWTGQEVPDGTENGILQAKEVSLMDLRNTRLVVLSACETGLGDVKGSEGVFGLQRSFKMAGVDFILMSLWSVPDEATRQLMTSFYENCFAGQSMRESFSNAQHQLRKLKKEYEDPYYWAGFVLME
jgi:CHAT domain-containing protein/tetratricopeptide (TPR) repeat protein